MMARIGITIRTLSESGTDGQIVKVANQRFQIHLSLNQRCAVAFSEPRPRIVCSLPVPVRITPHQIPHNSGDRPIAYLNGQMYRIWHPTVPEQLCARRLKSYGEQIFESSVVLGFRKNRVSRVRFAEEIVSPSGDMNPSWIRHSAFPLVKSYTLHSNINRRPDRRGWLASADLISLS